VHSALHYAANALHANCFESEILWLEVRLIQPSCDANHHHASKTCRADSLLPVFTSFFHCPGKNNFCYCKKANPAMSKSGLWPSLSSFSFFIFHVSIRHRSQVCWLLGITSIRIINDLQCIILILSSYNIQCFKLYSDILNKRIQIKLR
jgi:hypothetical protein